MDFTDRAGKPFVVDIEEITKANENFRTAIWTGKDLQMTLMSIKEGGDIGLEIHNENDQFLRVEQGVAKVLMGASKDNLDFSAVAESDFGIFIPAGVWHNVVNIGEGELKLYSLYGPAHHAVGTVHKTREEADEAEEHEHEVH